MKHLKVADIIGIVCFFPLLIAIPLGIFLYPLILFDVPKFVYGIVGVALDIWLAIKIK